MSLITSFSAPLLCRIGLHRWETRDTKCVSTTNSKADGYVFLSEESRQCAKCGLVSVKVFLPIHHLRDKADKDKAAWLKQFNEKSKNINGLPSSYACVTFHESDI